MRIAKRAVLGLIAGAALAAALPALAQEKFPDRPVTFVVPFPPGGPPMPWRASWPPN
jgi:tripartite-type tricarboxylate transporter receptor subunit TctC